MQQRQLLLSCSSFRRASLPTHVRLEAVCMSPWRLCLARQIAEHPTVTTQAQTTHTFIPRHPQTGLKYSLVS